MEDKRICKNCEHKEMVKGLRCPICDIYFDNGEGIKLVINSVMENEDAGVNCPLNIAEKRKQWRTRRDERLKRVDDIVKALKISCNAFGIKGAVVGISGGKDSTIVAALMTKVLGPENVLGVLMPNGVQKDISDSQRVVEFLNIPNMTVNIGVSFDGLYSEISRALKRLDENKSITEDARINIAPRLRMTTLYGIAQSMGKGWRVIGTTNKSEEYIGWLTKWGDGGVDFEPIMDLMVTELRKLGRYLGLPVDLVDKIPIDGLTHYSDEERFGFTYEELDQFMETGTTGKFEIDEKIRKMHAYSEHKRRPIPSFELDCIDYYAVQGENYDDSKIG